MNAKKLDRPKATARSSRRNLVRAGRGTAVRGIGRHVVGVSAAASPSRDGN
jgi:hypothetical protein